MKMLPDFKSEDEELAFWETHDPEDFDLGPAEDIFLDIRPEPKKPVSLRLEPSLIEELKRVAAAHDIPYQTLARGLIKRSLEQMRHGKSA
jgi:predicted DNA binding CopG/RHH family protein